MGIAFVCTRCTPVTDIRFSIWRGLTNTEEIHNNNYYYYYNYSYSYNGVGIDMQLSLVYTMITLLGNHLKNS